MMKKKILVIFFVSMTMFVYAQNTQLDNPVGLVNIPKETGRLLLREISISTFEDPTAWKISVPVDRGNFSSRRIFGSPAQKKPLRLEEQINQYQPVDQYVLGVKTEFYARSITSISIESERPIFMSGLVKSLSVWVAGRGKEHKLSVVIRDMSDEVKVLDMGKLNFSGWKKLEINIPTRFNQKDRNIETHGLYLLGFVINTKFEDTVGRYYIYFDDIRVISDVIDDAIKLNRSDTISDGW